METMTTTAMAKSAVGTCARPWRGANTAPRRLVPLRSGVECAQRRLPRS